MSGQKLTGKKSVANTKLTKGPSVNTASTTTTKVKNNQPKQRILQNFLLIWLDAKLDESNEQCQKNLKQLRSIINTIYTFQELNSCVHFLDQITDEKVFLIVSGALGESIMSTIHDKSSLDTIYVFCENKGRHEGWTKQWSKIKGIHTQISSICDALQKAVKQFNQDSISLSFVPNTSTMTGNLDQLEPSFMYTQIFKEILVELEYNEQSVQDLVNYCREQYAGNNEELKVIDEFARTYRPESVIWWYTRECFTYQMLNRALRTLESDIIMKMGFFIRDLHHQISTLHAQRYGTSRTELFTVYRGQRLSIEAFDKLERSKGGLISFNSFLSTSKKQEISLTFAKCAWSKSQSVGILFKMTIDPSIPSTPFASIKKLSYIDIEEEVLFSMHSLFRIGEIEIIDKTNRLYQVILNLTSDNDRELQNLAQRIREETNLNAKGWYRLGELLLKLGLYDKAEVLYTAVLEETANDKERGDIFYQLGRIKNKQGDYEKAISFYEKELEIDQKAFSTNPIALAYTYNNIGAVYDNMKDYTQARLCYEKALEIYQKHLPPDHPDLAAAYNNIGLLYSNIKQDTKAVSFYEKALEIKEKSLPSNHPLLAVSYNNIASVYYNMKDYSKSLKFYERTLDIEQRTLPANHPDLATTYNNIAATCEKMKEYSQALSFYERALSIKKMILPSDHPNLKETQEDIDYVKKKL